ncbi:hypothetical protein LTR15_000208 [Elasticomyces elasticus]|nr:hypothetical protein LTR15_000208 [Elasticomyces elasticus]
MATQVHVHVDGIGEQIAVAVKAAVEQAVKDVLSASITKNQSAVTTEPGFDIRAQILTNARVLWEMARSYYAEEHEAYNPELDYDKPPSLPQMFLVVSSCRWKEGQVNAVVRLQHAQSEHHVHRTVFLTASGGSVPEALQQLLETTMKLLGEQMYGSFTWGNAWDDSGVVWVEGAGCISMPTGMCDTCNERVWSSKHS